MLKIFKQFIFILRNLTNHPILLVISFLITIINVGIIAYTSLIILPLQYLWILKIIHFIILIFFTLENLLRLICTNPYIRSYFFLDFFTILPSWILHIFFEPQFYDLPASTLLRGVLFLRLVPLTQILLDEKTFHYKEKLPSFFNNMSSSLSIVVFTFIFLGSLFTSFLYAKYVETERENRIHQIQSLTKFYNVKEIVQKVPAKWILKIEQKETGKLYEIYYVNKDFLRDSLIPDVHFIFLEGKTPSEGILVSFLDLYKNKNYLETIFLITSFFMIAFTYLITRFYYRKYVFDPIEKAYNVLSLRLLGEDIQFTDLESMGIKKESNEITFFLEKVDEMYNSLMELELPSK
ncbi:MAG: hypothetical protein ACK4UJ_01775 [Leptonema sp. (in: bacteria)]